MHFAADWEEHEDLRTVDAIHFSLRTKMPLLHRIGKDFARLLLSCTFMQEEQVLYYYNHGEHLTTMMKNVVQRKPKPTPMPTCLIRSGIHTWKIAKFGVYNGTGNYDWHTLEAEISTPTNYMTGSFNIPISSDKVSQPIGLPPLQIHHLGVWVVPNMPMSAGMFGGIGSEQQCASEDGGMDCLLFTLPQGYGVPLQHAVRINTMVNDVRPKPTKVLKFNFQMAIRFADAPIRVVGTFYITHWDSKYDNGLFPKDDEFNVAWFSFKLSTSGEMATGKFHSHTVMPTESFLLTGPADQWFSRNDTDGAGEAWDENDFVSYDHTLRASHNLVCWTISNSVKVERSQYGNTPRVRFTGCNRWKFGTGDFATIVSMTKPRKCCGHVQHQVFLMVYLPAVTRSSLSRDYVHMWPSFYPSLRKEWNASQSHLR